MMWPLNLIFSKNVTFLHQHSAIYNNKNAKVDSKFPQKLNKPAKTAKDFQNVAKTGHTEQHRDSKWHSHLVLLLRSPDLVVQLRVMKSQAAVDGKDLKGLLILLLLYVS